jgi:hypothetical protein
MGTRRRVRMLVLALFLPFLVAAVTIPSSDLLAHPDPRHVACDGWNCHGLARVAENQRAPLPSSPRFDSNRPASPPFLSHDGFLQTLTKQITLPFTSARATAPSLPSPAAVLAGRGATGTFRTGR